MRFGSFFDIAAMVADAHAAGSRHFGPWFFGLFT